MGIYAGIIIGGFSGYVADSPSFGWRFAFSACGVVGVVYALPLLRDSPRSTEQRSLPAPWTAIRELFSNVGFVLLVLYFTLPALAGWLFAILSPLPMAFFKPSKRPTAPNTPKDSLSSGFGEQTKVTGRDPKKGKGRKSGSGAQPPVLLIGAGILVELLLVGASQQLAHRLFQSSIG